MRILKTSAIVVVIVAVFYLFTSGSYNNIPSKIAPIEEPDIAELATLEIVRIGNLERTAYGLKPLVANEKLSMAAEMKIDDMFENQYFDHVSPFGEEASDLVKLVKYSFIAVGENLATGNFKDEKDLVSRWMDSPGHRENILNPGYLEIGVAVRRGIFNGQEVWMAVQIFALPDHACPKPDQNLLSTISLNQKQLLSIRKNLEKLQKEIELTFPRDKDKILEYNEMVYRHNFLSDKTQETVEDYNLQIKLRNECISSYGF